MSWCCWSWCVKKVDHVDVMWSIAMMWRVSWCVMCWQDHDEMCKKVMTRIDVQFYDVSMDSILWDRDYDVKIMVSRFNDEIVWSKFIDLKIGVLWWDQVFEMWIFSFIDRNLAHVREFSGEPRVRPVGGEGAFAYAAVAPRGRPG